MRSYPLAQTLGFCCIQRSCDILPSFSHSGWRLLPSVDSADRSRSFTLTKACPQWTWDPPCCQCISSCIPPPQPFPPYAHTLPECPPRSLPPVQLLPSFQARLILTASTKPHEGTPTPTHHSRFRAFAVLSAALYSLICHTTAISPKQTCNFLKVVTVSYIASVVSGSEPRVQHTVKASQILTN